MARFLISLLLLLSITFIQCSNDKPEEQRKIVVYGTAEKEIQPDKMNWFLTVYNNNSRLEEVAQQHSSIVKQVVDFLKSQKINDKEIQTSGMQFGENWEFKNRSRIREGYFASSSITFSLNDLQKYEGLWKGLSKINSVSINGTQYDHTEKIGVQNEVRKIALIKAREKAESMANTLTMAVGIPVTIEEDLSVNERPWQEFMSNQLSAADRRTTQSPQEQGLATGTIKVAMRVKVTFEIGKK